MECDSCTPTSEYGRRDIAYGQGVIPEIPKDTSERNAQRRYEDQKIHYTLFKEWQKCRKLVAIVQPAEEEK